MERIRRLRFYIIAALVCAVLLCIATFSISYAMWTTGADSPTAEVTGESSLFYVEYPQYVTRDGDVAIPVLDENR